MKNIEPLNQALGQTMCNYVVLSVNIEDLLQWYIVRFIKLFAYIIFNRFIVPRDRRL